MEDGTPNHPNPAILINFSIETHHCGDPILRKRTFLVNIQKTMERSTMLLMVNPRTKLCLPEGIQPHSGTIPHLTISPSILSSFRHTAGLGTGRICEGHRTQTDGFFVHGGPPKHS